MPVQIVPGKDFGWITLSPPVAINDTYVITVNGTAPVYVLNNDSDPENNIDKFSKQMLGLSGPFNGTVLSVDPVLGIVNYQPNLIMLVRQFAICICDFTGLCDTAWIKITIAEPDTICNSTTNDTLYANTNPGDTSFTWTVPAGAVIVAHIK